MHVLEDESNAVISKAAPRTLTMFLVLHLLQTLGFCFAGHFLGFKRVFFCKEMKKVPAFKCIGQHIHDKPALHRIFV